MFEIVKAPQYIPIQVTQRKYCKNTILRKHRNPNNLVKVPLKSFAKSEGSKSAYVPTFLLSNVMSLAPKIDEVREVVQQENYDLVCLVETWLQDHIHDNVVHLPGCNLIRRDRSERIHGGVCIYVKGTIQSSRLDELSDDSFEVLWISLHPVNVFNGCVMC